MSKSTEMEIAIEILSFIKNKDTPIFVKDFVNRNLTGDQLADSLLREVALMWLQFMKKDGMIESDNLTSSEAKIYGLTDHGTQVCNLFILLNSRDENE